MQEFLVNLCICHRCLQCRMGKQNVVNKKTRNVAKATVGAESTIVQEKNVKGLLQHQPLFAALPCRALPCPVKLLCAVFEYFDSSPIYAQPLFAPPDPSAPTPQRPPPGLSLAAYLFLGCRALLNLFVKYLSNSIQAQCMPNPPLVPEPQPPPLPCPVYVLRFNPMYAQPHSNFDSGCQDGSLSQAARSPWHPNNTHQRLDKKSR